MRVGAVKKTISIRKDQANWIEEYNKKNVKKISLSKITQDAIDREMKNPA